MIVKCKGAGGAQEIGRAQEKIWIELGSKVWKREEKKGRKVKKSRKVEGVQRVRRWNVLQSQTYAKSPPTSQRHWSLAPIILLSAETTNLESIGMSLTLEQKLDVTRSTVGKS